MTRQTYQKNHNPLRFQDGYPVHWFSEASLRELCERAGYQYSWKRFRPQVVVDGLPANYEHQVAEGILDTVPFSDPKPCDRCAIPSVDPEAGIVTGPDPITVLRGYKGWLDREGKRKFIFGENMLPLDQGSIAVGDSLTVVKLRDPPLAYGPA